ncbi:four-helix bundle copper-binding protein [Azohydromonas aeria]|uniref:four-helix bundle copper-binding protein n=1 Tax=Azohydromonas aeria TaxID=2590212 RepID=UPI0012F8DE54|nr:four-helix bundle copper-binding protein [Azohydromonas aeria]
MENHPYGACIEACDACAAACDHCAVSCLQEPDPKPMARCIALDIDCAEVCRLASAAMARDSEHAQAICALCAQLCEACGTECGRHHHMEHCQECAEACLVCAAACRRAALHGSVGAP